MTNIRLINQKFSLKQLAAIFVVLVLIVAGASDVFAQAKKKKTTKSRVQKQDKTSLEAKKKDLQAQIELTDQLLKETRRTKTHSLSQLVALNKKIEARESLITEINNEITGLESQIDQNNLLVVQQDTEIAQLKRDYARMIVFAYRNQDAYHRVMFLFSADNINMAFMRMRYMQQIGASRRLQAEKITARQQELNENIRELEQQKSDKKALLGSNETEKQQLAVEKDDKDKTFRDLQAKESTLQDDLEKKKAEKASIDKAIQDLIAAEIARSEAAAKAKALAAANAHPKNNNGSTTSKPNNTTTASTPTKSNPNAPAKVELTPEAESLGNSFAGNKGGLPWPVAQGSITSHFGKQAHPVLKDVYVNNNGIDIATTSGAFARSVFEGEVTGVTNIPGSGWLVIVRHGEYLTVYAKLSEVLVKQGDKLKTKQNIGKIATDDDGQSTLHFEVWQSGTGKMDPEAWLLRGGK